MAHNQLNAYMEEHCVSALFFPVFFNATFNLMAQIQLQFIKANYIHDQQDEKSASENLCVITW